MKYALSIFFGLILTTLVGVFVAHAQDYTPLAPLPGTFTGATGSETTNISTYLGGMLKLLIALGAGVSILVAIIGGTQYVAAGIAPSAKQDAKERILNAFIGLTLVLTSYLILNSINPGLVQFNFSLPPIGTSPTPTTTGGGVHVPEPLPTTQGCPTPLTPLSGDALSFENGATVSYSSSNADVQQNLSKLQTEVNDLIATTTINYPGSQITVNSAYRPASYQKHLWEVWYKWKKLGLESNTNPACASLKTEIGAEYNKHGLGSLVSTPTGCAPHVKGTGVDINISGGPSDINLFMIKSGIDLFWQNIPGDAVHFNLRNAPYTGCVSI